MKLVSKVRKLPHLISGLMLVYSMSAPAAVVTAASVLYDEGPGVGLVLIGSTPNQSPGSSVSSAGYSGGILAASGFAHAFYGALHASGSAIATGVVAEDGPGVSTQTRGSGGATWIDQVTISSATAAGPGFARAYFSLSGALSSSTTTVIGAVANSTTAASVKINDSTVLSITGQLASQNGAISVNDKFRGQNLNNVFEMNPVPALSGTFAFDIPFVFGTPFQKTVDLTAFVLALATVIGDEASAFSNFGSTAYWGGISEVRLANGTPVTDYTLGSQSGYDWNIAYPAVPVPGAVWLLGSGLLGLGVRAARRRRGPEATGLRPLQPAPEGIACPIAN